jgi:hypothetical protein
VQNYNKIQEQFLTLAESMGYGAEVAYGFEEGQKIIQKYLQEQIRFG